MTFIVTYMVYGEAVGKGRPRFARRGNFTSTYTPQKTKTYEDEIKMMASAAMGSSEPLETPITVAIYISIGIPASFSKKTPQGRFRKFQELCHQQVENICCDCQKHDDLEFALRHSCQGVKLDVLVELH